MKTVFKYVLNTAFEFKYTIAMPLGARIVHVGEQGGLPTLWAEADPDAKYVDRHFAIFGTGKPVSGEYVGTCFNGPYVWHIYEVN